MKNFIKIHKTKKNFKGIDKKLTVKDLNRLKAMYIPPAYKTIYLHNNPNNKVQLIAEDNKGRNQYFYNPEYISRGELRKYKALRDLVAVMDKITADNNKHISRISSSNSINDDDLKHIVINMLLNNNFRIGNLKYDKLYNSSGITTLRVEHLRNDSINDNMKIEFIGKKGVVNIDEITCPKMKKILNLMKKKSQKNKESNTERYLFIKNNGGLITSDDVSNYLKEKYNAKITPKMFRTYNANYYMLYYIQNKMDMKEYDSLSTDSKKKAYVKKAIGEYVSGRLHNTPAVCRSKYINGKLMEKIINNPRYYSNLGNGSDSNIHNQLKKFIG